MRILTWMMVALLLALPAVAQNPPVAPPSQKAPATKAPPPKAPAAKAQKRRPPAEKKVVRDVSKEKALVAEQLTLLTRFIYLYARISASIEQSEAQARGNEAAAAVARNKDTRAKLAQNVGGIRAGIERVENAFQQNPDASEFKPKLLAASEAVGTAEQLAAAGKLDEAGRAMLVAAERLTDLLRLM